MIRLRIALYLTLAFNILLVIKVAYLEATMRFMYEEQCATLEHLARWTYFMWEGMR